tara:strand:- start:53 stop:526 length:474 start_codon:yes stop_codon:yes gene_type:complete
MAYKQPSSGPFKMMGSSPAKHGTTDDFLYGKNGHNPDIMEGKHEDWHTDKIEAEKKKPSPNKQNYKVLNDEELEESRKRMNSRIDAIEDMKKFAKEKGQAEDYLATGEKEAIAQINKQLKNKPVQGVNEPGKLPDLKAIEKLKNWKKGDKIKDLIKT